MKTILLIPVYIACLAYMALAGTCVVTWDTVPFATGYEVFRGAEKLTTVSTNEAEITLPDDAISTLHVIAINGPDRSEPSNILHVLPWRPQFSLDLTTWDEAATVYSTIPTPNLPPRAFVRASFPAISLPAHP